MPDSTEQVTPDEEEGYWRVEGGRPVEIGEGHPWRDDGSVDLDYSNPFRQDIERVWFDGRVVYAVECGELDLDLDTVKVAQEYQLVYSVQLDDKGKLAAEPDRVDGQYNIYDSVPGMEKYSPLWQFNYVIVPRDYEANTLRSEGDCLASGYEIRRSTVVEN
ncbi:MAG TPA: hypothetical protein VL337_11535 [Acidimicrobiales bacterium]|jgi:hypothetical protein|nr:hypothetical protein [Acidimicrobiales bacterium]